jgi:hypothetical protein
MSATVVKVEDKLDKGIQQKRSLMEIHDTHVMECADERDETDRRIVIGGSLRTHVAVAPQFREESFVDYWFVV